MSQNTSRAYRMTDQSSSLFPGEKPQADLAELGERLAKATGGLRVKAVSWHDADGGVLWSSQPLLGIEQREAIRDALESFSGVGARMRVDRALGELDTAVLLRASDRAGNTLGFAMLIVDARALRSKGRGADLPVPALQIVHEFGRTLAQRARQSVPTTAQARAAEKNLNPGGTVNARDVGPEIDRELAELRELQLALHVQALFPLRPSARIRRYEVLLRSRTADGESAAAPVDVLDRAARSGLGTVIDRRVITQLIAWLRKRTDIVEGGPCLFSVNLSPTALQDEHFLRFIGLCLAKAHLPRGLLAFEIQAEALLRRQENSRRVAQALQSIGCGLVIDDFQMSEGQLELLRLPGVRMIKMDPSLTNAAVDDVFSQAKVAACAQIARICGCFTVAKRVESDTTRDLCRSLGIDFVQGFAFAGPAPIDSIVALDAIEEDDGLKELLGDALDEDDDDSEPTPG
jgi:EAL domain-containing protein (putative c-di-GMP-specific phosphodiesterase class I)